MAKYEVQQGDTIPSIALDTGFFWETLWNLGDNAQLKSLRKNPNILYPGDQVEVPAIKTKDESKGTGASYKYKRKGDPIKFAVKFMKPDGTPRANEAYVLHLGEKTIKGNTDGNGLITLKVPGDVKGGVLNFQDGKEVHNLQMGALDPVDVTSGIQHRLSNLGYDVDPSGEMDDATMRALQNFQTDHGVPVSGKICEATKSKLLSLMQ